LTPTPGRIDHALTMRHPLHLPASLLVLATLLAAGAATPTTRSADLLQFRPVLPDDDPSTVADVFPNPIPGGHPAHFRVARTVILSTPDVTRAAVQQDNDGRPAVTIDFTDAAANRFADFTGSHLGQRLAILVDGKLLSAPTIQSRIGRSCMITGSFSKDETHRIAAALNPPHPTTAP
jgi:preprotein translocase subunit SecD